MRFDLGTLDSGERSLPFWATCFNISCVDISAYQPLLTWSKVEKNVSWGVILLLGGGFAIAKASKVRKDCTSFHHDHCLYLFGMFWHRIH